MGRPPVPTRVLQMRGTYRADRHEGTEVVSSTLVKVPKAPQNLGEIAKRIWKQTARRLIAIELLTENDLGRLEGYCIAYERAIEAEAVVKAEGRTIQTAQGLKRHPELVTAERARAEMQRSEQVFGMTPSDRARMRVPTGKSDAPENGFRAVARAAAREG